jgi:cell division protein FtsX
LLGSLLAITGLYFGYSYLINQLALSIQFLPFLTEFEAIYPVYLLLLISGLTLGALGSLVAVGRYLKM